MILAILCFGGTVLCGYLAWEYGFEYRTWRQQMMAHLQPEQGAVPPTLRRVEQWFADTGPGEAAAAYLAKAGLPMSPLKYVLILTALDAGLYLLATSFLGLGWVGGLSLAMTVLPFLTQMYLRMRRQQFLRDLQGQLPEVAGMISNALKAGYSLTQAIAFVADQARPPVQPIFRRCRGEVELGRSLDDALANLIGRYDSPDLRLMVASMLVQKTAGGNLIAALDGIARTIRRRQETLGEVQATLAQAQQTVKLLPWLPLFCALMFNVAMPGFLQPLFTAPGLIILAVVVVLQIGASLIIRRLARIEV